ncbi:MAG: cation diffusion facilitator family transporter [Candidatus Jordarchaeaceae archaeon]
MTEKLAKENVMRVYKKVSIITMIALGVVAITEFVIGRLTDTVGILANSYNNLSDVLSIIIVFVGLIVSEKPPDVSHPYGHYKAENIASLFVGFIIILAGVDAIWESFHKFLYPTPAEVNVLSVGTILFAVAVSRGIAIYYKRVGEKTGSPSLVAESKHFNVDVYLSLSPLAGLVAVYVASLIVDPFTETLNFLALAQNADFYQQFLIQIGTYNMYYGYMLVDPLVGIGISLMVFWVGFNVSKNAVNVLMEKVPYPEIVEEIKKVVEEHPPVQRVAQIRARSAGRYVLIDLILELKPDMKLKESHYVTEEVRNIIWSRFPRAGYILIETRPSEKRGEEVIAFPTDEDDGIESRVCSHFGKCKNFVLVKLKDKKVVDVETVSNPAIKSVHGKGTESAEFLYGKGINALVCKNLGKPAFYALRNLGVFIYESDERPVRELVDDYLNQKLKILHKPSSAGHSEE